uniref:ShKT domain-containing protein n=1 Tax=Corethron hystrix TaxID=216773 RepID=A0A7S1BXI9_9STRA|mmetsp:Transcript_5874/g.12467  ORF Transcript_5874/g.12467 Transcript_5874/m.12467 type:complete len:249 (+) Transcript_5874:468-1214(+)
MKTIIFFLPLVFSHVVSGANMEIVQNSPSDMTRSLDGDGWITYEKAVMEKQVEMGVIHDKFNREECLNRPTKYRWRCVTPEKGPPMCRCAPKRCRGTPSYGKVYSVNIPKKKTIVWRCPLLPAYCGYGEPKCIYKANNKKKWRCRACSVKRCNPGKIRVCKQLKSFNNYHKCECVKTKPPTPSPTERPTVAPTICKDAGHKMDYRDISLCIGWVTIDVKERCGLRVEGMFARVYCPFTCNVCRDGEKW